MFQNPKCRARREEIRKNRPDAAQSWNPLKSPPVLAAAGIAVGFWIIAVAITTLREQIPRARADQFVHQDILSRVAFDSINHDRVNELRQQARDSAPRVYRVNPTSFANLERDLLSLPSDVTNRSPDQLPKDLKLDSGSITLLKKIQTDPNGMDEYRKWVHSYVEQL